LITTDSLCILLAYRPEAAAAPIGDPEHGAFDGYEVVAVYTGGTNEDRLLAANAKIDELQAKHPGVRVMLDFAPLTTVLKTSLSS
jgi:hypothetical protein